MCYRCAITLGRMLKISLKLGMVMKSYKDLEKYMPVSPKSFLIGLIAGCFFVHFKFDGFVQENASFLLIKWGAVIGAITMFVALILSFIPDKLLKAAVVEKILEATNLFVGIGLFSLASCLMFYSKTGWTTELTIMALAGLGYWLGINRAFYQISHVEMSSGSRVCIWVFSIIILVILVYFLKGMILEGKLN
ncbi:membrane hypothetical protein [Pseudomonas lundensis]|uniref:Uncharacterized protein n=2 Tax=Pseudomonas lundensis TaxID=86185 RepID=A0AAX2H5B4_9PSED|nr:membrane hypothetical protein [Pseudomonas lundensis]